MSVMTVGLRSATGLDMAMIPTLVIIDVLFPGTTGGVKNPGIIVAQFSKKGLAGPIALLLFLIVFKNG